MKRQMKRAGIRGLIILSAIVLICIFFSDTFHTITTAKVQMTKSRNGRLEGTMTLSGNLHWPETESIYISSMTAEDIMIVLRMNVSVGSYVRAGDLIAECDVNEYETRMETLRSSFTAKEKEYLEQERKYGSLQLNPQQVEWANAYQRIKEALLAVSTLRQELQVAARQSGLEMIGDNLPAGVEDEALTGIQNQLLAALQEESEAHQAFEKANRAAISDEIVNYLEKKEELEKEMEELTGQMADLRYLKETSDKLYAPHEGYITLSDIKVGETLGRNTPLVQMTVEDKLPVIRLDATELRRMVSENSAVVLTAGEKTLETSVGEQGISSDGQVYIDVPLRKGDLAALGGFSAVSESNAVSAQISWKSETVSTLIPTSALRGSESNYHLYLARESTDSFGTVRYYTEEKSVTVLGQSDTVTSIEEDLSGKNIVYMEDRPLTNNMEVMLYSSN